MGQIDMDALRAAREETEQEPKSLKLGGEVFSLPDVLGADFLIALGRTLPDGRSSPDWSGILDGLFGDQRARFLALKPDVRDLNDLIPEITRLYTGASSGESQASADS